MDHGCRGGRLQDLVERRIPARGVTALERQIGLGVQAVPQHDVRNSSSANQRPLWEVWRSPPLAPSYRGSAALVTRSLSNPCPFLPFTEASSEQAIDGRPAERRVRAWHSSRPAREPNPSQRPRARRTAPCSRVARRRTHEAPVGRSGVITLCINCRSREWNRASSSGLGGEQRPRRAQPRDVQRSGDARHDRGRERRASAGTA